MTRYALDKVLWRYGREADFKAAFDAKPAAAIAGMELSDEECRALETRDARAIFLCGAHPFLLYSFTIASEGGWSFDMMQRYVGALEGLEPGDIET